MINTQVMGMSIKVDAYEDDMYLSFMTRSQAGMISTIN